MASVSQSGASGELLNPATCYAILVVLLSVALAKGACWSWLVSLVMLTVVCSAVISSGAWRQVGAAGKPINLGFIGAGALACCTRFCSSRGGISSSLTILEQPRDVSLHPGSAFTISVKVLEPSRCHFQWYRDGWPVLHETQPFLQVTVADRHHFGAYTIKIEEIATGQQVFSDVVQVSSSTPKQTRLYMLFHGEGPWVTSAGCASVDLVFVHDLWGDYKQSWTNAKGELWPSDFVRDQYPYARVLSYDYPAQPSFWFDGAESLDLERRSKNLLECLVAKAVGTRPVIFVGHGMGGLLIKVLLAFASNPIVAGAQ